MPIPIDIGTVAALELIAIANFFLAGVRINSGRRV
jgi:hypothetical protein